MVDVQGLPQHHHVISGSSQAGEFVLLHYDHGVIHMVVDKLCPCYFNSPSEKCTNTFGIVQGIISGFNTSHRKITSGVEKTSDYNQ